MVCRRDHCLLPDPLLLEADSFTRSKWWELYGVPVVTFLSNLSPLYHELMCIFQNVWVARVVLSWVVGFRAFDSSTAELGNMIVLTWECCRRFAWSNANPHQILEPS